MSDFNIQIWTYNEYIDFSKYKKRPTAKGQFNQDQIFPATFNYNSSTILARRFQIRMNQIQTQDDRFQTSKYSYQSSFYDIFSLQSFFDTTGNVNYDQKHVIYISLEIGPASILYQRISYSLIEVAKDCGGLTNVMIVIFSLLNMPLANFSSFTKAIKRLYFAKTKDSTLFKSKDQNLGKYIEKFYKYYGDDDWIKNKKNMRIINFSNYDYICLYFLKILGKNFCCKFCWPKHKKMELTITEGSKRIN